VKVVKVVKDFPREGGKELGKMRKNWEKVVRQTRKNLVIAPVLSWEKCGKTGKKLNKSITKLLKIEPLKIIKREGL
jgi:hypothetical protein